MFNALPVAVYVPATNGVKVQSHKDGVRWIIARRSERDHVIDCRKADEAETPVGPAMLALANLGVPKEDMH